MDLAGPQSDYETLSYGVGVCTPDNRRVVADTLIAGSGSGPDGSSLTANYQRSRGSGVEEQCGKPAG